MIRVSLTLDHGQPDVACLVEAEWRAGDQFVGLLDPLEHLARLQWSRRQVTKANSLRERDRLRQAKVVPAAGPRHLGGARQQHHEPMRHFPTRGHMDTRIGPRAAPVSKP